MQKVGIGQDSHRFEKVETEKKCTIGGVIFEDLPGLDADSDGDVIFHAICNAITSITHLPVLGEIAPKMVREEGIRDSAFYLKRALESLEGYQILHVALTVEGKRPRMQKRSEEIRSSIANQMGISLNQVGITFTSGDELTAFGRGEGLQAFCILSVNI